MLELIIEIFAVSHGFIPVVDTLLEFHNPKYVGKLRVQGLFEIWSNQIHTLCGSVTKILCRCKI
jgi:hypothetical protein